MTGSVATIRIGLVRQAILVTGGVQLWCLLWQIQFCYSSSASRILSVLTLTWRRCCFFPRLSRCSIVVVIAVVVTTSDVIVGGGARTVEDMALVLVCRCFCFCCRCCCCEDCVILTFVLTDPLRLYPIDAVGGVRVLVVFAVVVVAVVVVRAGANIWIWNIVWFWNWFFGMDAPFVNIIFIILLLLLLSSSSPPTKGTSPSSLWWLDTGSKASRARSYRPQRLWSESSCTISRAILDEDSCSFSRSRRNTRMVVSSSSCRWDDDSILR